jgi:hypothetical protein
LPLQMLSFFMTVIGEALFQSFSLRCCCLFFVCLVKVVDAALIVGTHKLIYKLRTVLIGLVKRKKSKCSVFARRFAFDL